MCGLYGVYVLCVVWAVFSVWHMVCGMCMCVVYVYVCCVFMYVEFVHLAR